MKNAFNRVSLADETDSISVEVSVRQKLLLSFTANKSTLGSSFNLVNFEMVKALDVLDELIIFGSFLIRAC